METVHNPHDKLFHEIYSRKEEARSFLENFLPDALWRQLDADSLDICKDSFIDEELQEYYSDLLYTVNISGQVAYIYVLFEHKSYSERFIHLQLLEYIVKIWRLHLKQHPLREAPRRSPHLPIILPLVIYHGEYAWPYSIRLSDEIIGPKDSFMAYLPDFEVMMIDLSAYPDDDIKGTLLSRVVLLLFKHIFDPDLRPELPKIFRLMNELLRQESGDRYLEVFFRYLCSAANNIDSGELIEIARQALEPQGGQVMMTVAEQLYQQGHEKGRQEGAIIGEILFAQKALKIETYTWDDLQSKNSQELQQILSDLEARLIDRHVLS